MKGVFLMSTEDNKAIVRRVIEEIWSKGNIPAVDEHFAPNCVAHVDSPTNAPVPAEEQFILDGFKHFVSQWRTTFPDLQQTIELQVARSGSGGDSHGCALGAPGGVSGPDVSGHPSKR